MIVAWNDEARLEARDIRRMIAADHPRAAKEWRRGLARRIDILRQWPLAGRTIPEFRERNLRELIFGNYRIWYRVTRDAVEIMRIWDARQEAPTQVREALREYVVLAFASIY